MTIAEKDFKDYKIKINSGKIFAINNECSQTVGEIAKIELSIEHPKQLLGISRVESVIFYNKEDEPLYNDQNIVDNTEYHSDEDLLCAITKHYDVSKDLIEIIY